MRKTIFWLIAAAILLTMASLAVAQDATPVAVPPTPEPAPEATAATAEPTAVAPEASPAEPADQAKKPGPWFAKDRLPSLVIIATLTLMILFFIRHAKRAGGALFIRKIAGLEAVDDAVGRATEMGKPVLFIPGIGDMSMLATLAALSILRRVSRLVAEYQAKLLVPCSDPIVHPTAQETVKMAYLEAGRPDLFQEDQVNYLTYDQFGYAAGVDGIMMREKPGAVFMQGWFAAEALVMAETGNSIGAIQIAGTDQTSQLPFLVAACDYTLIGEELYAAASYLSRDPVQLATLKSQDVLKLVLGGAILIGAGLATAAALAPHGWAASALRIMTLIFSGSGTGAGG
ncbi:MAG: hypothetical protein GX444_05750 [Myxococcales bacterium]|nr:hypothetical protein [Myxococcales bacterium]